MDEKLQEALERVAREKISPLQELMRSSGKMPDLGYIRPRNTAVDRMNEMIRSINSAPQIHADNVQEAIRSHITRLQSGLSENEELFIYHGTGMEFIRILEISFPNNHVVILFGHDANGNAASAVLNISGINLTCKIVKVEAPAKPYRIGFQPPEPE